MNSEKLLEVKKLSMEFKMYEKGLRQQNLQVITDLNITVKAGEIVAVVGSSGSGKSLLASAILQLLPGNASVSGEISYQGEVLTKERLEQIRGKEIAYVPQSVANLDPLMRIDQQVIGLYGSREKQRRLFKKYHLEDSVERMYPHQLSGGMARRVLISGAVINDAKLVIADEPTPGLSQSIAEQIMQDFRDLADAGCGVLLITHDINLAIRYADVISVFYAGTTIESAPVEDFVAGEERLRHPYSKALWRALPQNGFQPIPGAQPYAGTVKKGCPFFERCTQRTEKCQGEIPQKTIRNGEVKCLYAT